MKQTSTAMVDLRRYSMHHRYLQGIPTISRENEYLPKVCGLWESHRRVLTDVLQNFHHPSRSPIYHLTLPLSISHQHHNYLVGNPFRKIRHFADPFQARNAPPPPPRLASPSEGSESDDELSAHERKSTFDEPKSGSRQAPAVSTTQSTRVNAGSIAEETSSLGSEADLVPENARTRGAERNVPPASVTEQAYAPSSRAPPPPPLAPAPKDTVSESKVKKPGRHDEVRDASEEEITEYEGDYDTDIASGARHKDALKAPIRTPSLEDESMAEEASLHHSGLPSIGPPMTGPRAAPPPPPLAQGQKKRQSSDMPRAAPPPPPPPKRSAGPDEEYDPYSYHSPLHGIMNPDLQDRSAAAVSAPSAVEAEAPRTSTSQHRRLPSADLSYASPSIGSSLPMPAGSDPRASSEMHRSSTTIRRSTDMSRPSAEHHMATDIDLNQDFGWWTRPKQAPSSVQNRKDIIYEVDESSTSRRGGKTSISKDVYILYMDYSQTIISVQFEASDPDSPSKLEQKHEPPPRIPRQDQLEAAHQQFGSRVADLAKTNEGSIVGDGSAQALPAEFISQIAGVLPPVGNRSYGALVYANLANATVQQHDEIRSGDIITFRNTKFGGHRGPVKTKYSNEVGKPDHVGIVVDWDGTKKKVRAWEQGRENKKVKIESFKFGDLKSGEIRVWRPMSRAWVGWEDN